ncbi:uncharacterized protein LOC124325967 isoform X1 [Daphnia pulicaria]|uniref:uncharacterized protein LOC124325967 isoform X1 n=1 Tax=Daphnia pulicaria TaxID=35523 RepID=UPI001EECBBFB|nr:uncharacterized protein LOC124325967 isoform X1 [Daphnia pulicaria]
MGYYTVLPGSRPEDNDMILYGENAEDIQTVMNSTPRELENDAGENPAEISEILVISSADLTPISEDNYNINERVVGIADDDEVQILVRSESRIPEVVEIEGDDEVDVIASTSSSPNSSRFWFQTCSKCKQIRRGHKCPFKNSSVTVVDVREKPTGRSSTASKRKRVENDESLDTTCVTVEDAELSDIQMSAPTSFPSENDATIASTRTARTASNRGSLSLLAQRDEYNESSDLDWRISSCDEREGAPQKKKRKISCCSYCGAILKGHRVNGQCPRKIMDEQKRQLSGTPTVIISKI